MCVFVYASSHTSLQLPICYDLVTPNSLLVTYSDGEMHHCWFSLLEMQIVLVPSLFSLDGAANVCLKQKLVILKALRDSALKCSNTELYGTH